MKKITLLLLAFFVVSTCLDAQKVLDAADNVKEMKDDVPDGWKKGGGIGLDLAILNLINPRVGAGDNRLGFGGLLTLFANNKSGRFIWENKFGLQENVVRIGGSDNPFEKGADILRLTSQFGYRLGNPKLYVAGLFDLSTQFLSTYGKNSLSETTADKLSSKFMSPGVIKFAPGLLYRANPHFSVLYSPIALKMVIVSDENLASLGNPATQTSRLGNPWRSATDFDKVDFQVGSELRLDYNNKFANDKIIYKSTLDFYSNYRRQPQNIDVEFLNSIDFVIIKNISINVILDMYYDHDILVQKGGDALNLGRDVFINNAVLIKYNTNL
jgi:Protein of unknown function (DUF3078)